MVEGGGECPVSAVFDGRAEKELCPSRARQGAARQRLLHSTDNNELSLHFKTTTHDPSPTQTNFYLLHYEGLSSTHPSASRFV